MNQALIAQYNISLQNIVFDWGQSGKKVKKSISTNNEYLTTFLNCWNSILRINDSLLMDIEQALLNPSIESETDSVRVDIIMINNLVDFYHSDLGYVNSMPLQDFKEIVIGWRDFLNTPPLNGTKVL